MIWSFCYENTLFINRDEAASNALLATNGLASKLIPNFAMNMALPRHVPEKINPEEEVRPVTENILFAIVPMIMLGKMVNV